MNIVATLSNDDITRYRRACTGEKLGWIIFLSEETFVRVHRVLSHPEDGPVIIIGNNVLEVDPDDHDAYESEDAAKEAYYAGLRFSDPV